jgi:hypothetical protein
MRMVSMAAAAAALVLSAGAANATEFIGHWSLLVGNNSDPGHLAIQTVANDPSQSFDMHLGEPPVFPAASGQTDLFKIYTTEGSIEPDDLNGTTLTLTFNFSQPSDNPGPVTIGGTSSGYSVFFGVFQGGVLTWSNTGLGAGVAAFQWGQHLPNLVEPGNLTLSVNGGTFNGGIGGTDRDCVHRVCTPLNDALQVRANFDWDNNPVVAAPAPEPATWALMLGGFGLAGAALRRRRATAVTA